jgi:hypothetical protein
MASSQGTSVSSNSFSRWASHDTFHFKYHFLLHILRFLFFFSDNIMADVASKQQTTALFLCTIVTQTRRHTELTIKLTNLMGNLCCAREHSVQFFVQFFIQLTLGCLRPFLGVPLKQGGINPSAPNSCTRSYYSVLNKPVWRFVLGQREKEWEGEEAETETETDRYLGVYRCPVPTLH